MRHARRILSLLPVLCLVAHQAAAEVPPAMGWQHEATVFHRAENRGRPEFCFVGDRVYVAVRKTISDRSYRGGYRNEAWLELFDVDPSGNWNERTRELFADSPHLLYGPRAPAYHGHYTDHQLVCDESGFYLVYEGTARVGNLKGKPRSGRGGPGRPSAARSGVANSGPSGEGVAENPSGGPEPWRRDVVRQVYVRRFHPDFRFDREVVLFEDSRGLEEYKLDDAGAALLDGTLFVWGVKLGAVDKRATHFALYGLDPRTLATVVDDGSGGPKLLHNPRHSPFAGVLDLVGEEYRLLSAAHGRGSPLAQDRLVEYRYDREWRLIGHTELPRDLLAGHRALYPTGRAREGEREAWGFTFERNEDAPRADGGGEAWVRVVEPDGTEGYFRASARDDTLHTTVAFHGGKLYVGYKLKSKPHEAFIERFGPVAAVGETTPAP